MTLGESLVQAGLIEAQDVDKALQHQATSGGTLGQALIALGVLTSEQLEKFFRSPPPTIHTLADTGLKSAMLSGLVLKIMHLMAHETASAIAGWPAPIEWSSFSLSS